MRNIEAYGGPICSDKKINLIDIYFEEQKIHHNFFPKLWSPIESLVFSFQIFK